jgi:hypothetical protein
MGHWEYLTIEISLEHNEYVVTFTSGRKLYGLNLILDEFDERGWEYINMVPNLRRNYLAYLAFFRRPRTADSSQGAGRLE